MGNQVNFSNIAITLAITAATGGAGAAASTAFSSLASQAVQQGIQNLGLSPELTSAMQAAFNAGAGNWGDMARNAGDFAQALRNGSSPSDYGNLERALADFQREVEQFFRQMNKELGGDEGSKKKAGDKGGAPDFFIAMARALGEALQNQADKVQKLSNELSTAVGNANGKTGDSRADAQNAIMEVQTELMGESMRLNYMAQGIHTALSKVGDALSTMGRAN